MSRWHWSPEERVARAGIWLTGDEFDNPIRCARIRQGLTRRVARRALGIGQGTLEDWERRGYDVTRIPYARIERLALVLGCTIEDLVAPTVGAGSLVRAERALITLTGVAHGWKYLGAEGVEPAAIELAFVSDQGNHISVLALGLLAEILHARLQAVGPPARMSVQGRAYPAEEGISITAENAKVL